MATQDIYDEFFNIHFDPDRLLLKELPENHKIPGLFDFKLIGVQTGHWEAKGSKQNKQSKNSWEIR